MTAKDKRAPGGPAPAKVVPAGRIKALLDGMAQRQAGLMAAGDPPQDLPVTATMDREWFRAEFKVSGVEPDNVTLRVEGDQLVVTIGIGGGMERIDEGSRRVEANARIWERSFKLPFKPVLSATRTTVTPDSVTVEAARLR